LTVLHAQEREEPTDRPRIDWKLITNLPVATHEDAVEKLRRYALRWKIEGVSQDPEIRLRSRRGAAPSRRGAAPRRRAPGQAHLGLFCILAWRVFWMTMINRSIGNAEPSLALTDVETALLDRLVPDKENAGSNKTLSVYLTKIARLGGYLARTRDPPPGSTVMWRGLSRLTDIKLGAALGTGLVGK
jgi:hypothetical protein